MRCSLVRGHVSSAVGAGLAPCHYEISYPPRRRMEHAQVIEYGVLLFPDPTDLEFETAHGRDKHLSLN
jgi:hypothetical protein